MLPERLRNAVDLTQARLQKLHGEPLKTMNLAAAVLRCDLIHPVISGNKWYKLSLHLEKALVEGASGLLTCGGAFSNHIVAASLAGKLAGIPTTGLIRGEPGKGLSVTLQEARENGMELVFVPRSEFRTPGMPQSRYAALYPGYHWIPEGGCSALGIAGAAGILDGIRFDTFTHILCACGTGTMMAGLLQRALGHQEVIGIPVLKIADQQANSLEQLLNEQVYRAKWKLLYGFHEGGYAKSSTELFCFMNRFYQDEGIPTDFVYTGKLFKAIYGLAASGYFPENSRLLIIHSGGLQGNRSLPEGTLSY